MAVRMLLLAVLASVLVQLIFTGVEGARLKDGGSPCYQCQSQPPVFHCRPQCQNGYYKAGRVVIVCDSDSAEEKNRRQVSPSQIVPTSIPLPSTTSTSQQGTTPNVTMAPSTVEETCLKCDPACDCCGGPGPKNCSKCAIANNRDRPNMIIRDINVSHQPTDFPIFAIIIVVCVVAFCFLLSLSVVLYWCCWKAKEKGKGKNKVHPSHHPDVDSASHERVNETVWSTHLDGQTHDEKDPRGLSHVNRGMSSRNTSSCQQDTLSGSSRGVPLERRTHSPDIEADEAENLPSCDPNCAPPRRPPSTCKPPNTVTDNRSGKIDLVISPTPTCDSGYSTADSSESCHICLSTTTLSSVAEPSERDNDKDSSLHWVTNSNETPDSPKAESDNTKDGNPSSSSTQTFSKDDVPTPIISDSWQYSKEVSSKGGVVQKINSDVRLEIPDGAIERGTDVTIYEAVNTDFQMTSRKLKLSKGENIISPVAEFSAGPNLRFIKEVLITLPLLMPSTSKKDRIWVYQFDCNQEGQVQLRKLELRESASKLESGTYCFEQGNRIIIAVRHFSGVLCTRCGLECSPPDLYLDIFVGMLQKSENQWDVDVQLEIWDNDIKDFREDQQHRSGLNCVHMHKVDSKMLHAVVATEVPKMSDLGLLVGIEIDHEANQEWTHYTRGNGSPVYPPQEVYDLKWLARCEMHPFKRPLRKDWWLTNKSGAIPSRSFQCLVDVGYVLKQVDREAESSSEFIKNPKEITFKISFPSGTQYQRSDSAEFSRSTESNALEGSAESDGRARASPAGLLSSQRTDETLVKTTHTNAQASSVADTARQDVVINIQKAGDVSVTASSRNVANNSNSNEDDNSERTPRTLASSLHTHSSTTASSASSCAVSGQTTPPSRQSNQERMPVPLPVSISQEPDDCYSTEV